MHRADGGGHEAENLILLCSACHAAHHRGNLQIGGTAAHLEVERVAELRARCAHVDANGPKDDAGRRGAGLRDAMMRAQAQDALIGLGWRPAIATAAVKAAEEALGEVLEGDAGLSRLIAEALRRCPRPAS